MRGSGEMRQAFVLLEMMNHMVLVAREAKARGFLIVALNHDRPSPSGPFGAEADLVDEYVHIASWGDSEAVGAAVDSVVERYDIVGTYSAFEATLPYDAALRERVGLPNNGAGNVPRVLDKAAVRRRLFAEGLSFLRSATLTEARQWSTWPFAGSAILKPANGTGSALCFRVADLEELRAAAEQVDRAAVVNPLMRQYILDRGEFVLEELAEGELLSVESLVNRGTVHTIGIQARYVLASDPVVEMGFLFPYHHPRSAEIFEKAQEFHRIMGIVHGPTQIEVMVPDEGPIELIDFNIRSSGSASIVTFGQALGTRHEVALADLACGVDPDLSFLDRPTRFAAQMFLLPPPGAVEFHELEFPAGTVFHRPTRQRGDQLSGRADQLDVVGGFTMSADSAAELHRGALRARREAVFNGVPLGDNPNNILAFSDHLGRELAPVR
jgi:hypothetical protein